MKILHGMCEIAGQGINTVKGLRANGHDAVMAVRQRNYMADQPDIDLNIVRNGAFRIILSALKMGRFAVKALVRFDVMHTHSGYSLLPFNMDAYLYRLFKFKCFAEFHGTDIRFMYNTDIEYPYYKNNYLNSACRTSDLTFAQIEVISPSGTRSILKSLGSVITYVVDPDNPWELFSNAFYGEKAQGNWQVRIIFSRGERSTRLTSEDREIVVTANRSADRVLISCKNGEDIQ